MAFLIAGITLGFLGSFHCIGMCGPIALSLPVHQYGAIKKHIAVTLYNVGRILTYMSLGFLFGLFGCSFSLAGFQQWVSIIIGGVLLVFVFMPGFWMFKNSQIPVFTNVISKLKTGLANLFSKRGLRFLFLIGLLNGLLPCGLVYIGIAGAIASQDVIKGTLFMMGFGLGTIPVMYSVASFGLFINVRYRTIAKKTVPFVVSVMALLLILRGLNLGIPYVSPVADTQEKTMSCCEIKPSEKK